MPAWISCSELNGKATVLGILMRGFSRQYRTICEHGNQDWNFTLGYLLFGHERKPRL